MKLIISSIFLIFFFFSFSFAYSLLPIDSNHSNGSINTLTNELKEDMTPILIKKKSHSAPESDTSDSIYEAMPQPKKKLSLDETASSKRASTSSTITEFLKEKSQRKLQEKDLDEASNCSSLSRLKTASPAGTLRSVSRKTGTMLKGFFIYRRPSINDIKKVFSFAFIHSLTLWWREKMWKKVALHYKIDFS